MFIGRDWLIGFIEPTASRSLAGREEAAGGFSLPTRLLPAGCAVCPWLPSADLRQLTVLAAGRHRRERQDHPDHLDRPGRHGHLAPVDAAHPATACRRR
jgi:hypothetical protein